MSFVLVFIRLGYGNPKLTDTQRRTANLPPLGRSTLRACRDHHHLLLGGVLDRPRVDLFVLQVAEQEEGHAEIAAGIREVAESGVLGSDGQGESGVCLLVMKGFLVLTFLEGFALDDWGGALMCVMPNIIQNLMCSSHDLRIPRR